MRIVVFADGTWNKPDPLDGGTNVDRLCKATIHDPAGGQTVLYDRGVGSRWHDKIRGGVLGAGLTRNVTDAYDFIARQWTGADDEIFLFGFSRGAYTVRTLAGLMNFAGLIRDPGTRQERRRLIRRAYDLYRHKALIAPPPGGTADPEWKREYETFQGEHVQDARTRATIRMLGVWDTVGALGIPQSWLNEKLNPAPQHFHDLRLGKNVANAYHAVSIDEKRKSFRPALWEDDPRAHQVWFAGAHSDVGGGYGDDNKLAKITLRWMADHAIKHGLRVKEDALPQLDGSEYCGKAHESWRSYWRLVRRDDRQIPPGSRISVHVRQRLEEQDGKKFPQRPYAPPTLTRPWERYLWD